MPSLVDRLIDVRSQGTPDRPWYGVDEMIEAVSRDLNDLLNTRQTHQALFDGLPEVQNSLLAYGFPDITSFEAATAQQQAEIGRVIEEAVQRFEPRLKDVRAVMLDPPDGKRTLVRFRVEASLAVEPAPEVAFETTVELSTGQYEVQAVG